MSRKKNICFAIMPFQDFDNQWELAFKPAIQEAGLEPLRADEKSLGTNAIVNDITSCIFNACMIIADVSGRNSNVLYELGLAHAAKKPVVILVQDEQDVPFDLRHIRYLKYSDRKLPQLRPELTERIKNTMAMDEKSRPDFFPELRVMSESVVAELEYLRQKSRSLRISVVPENADIFFNDRFIGSPPQVVRVNPEAHRNTVSAVAVEHLETYMVVMPEDIERGEVTITLESAMSDVNWNKLVPQWLRFRRKYPDNPVLMRAVAKYFSDTGSAADALAEAKELIEAAPLWYMAQIMLGYVLLKPVLEKEPGSDANLDEAAKYFRNAIVLEPHHYVGYFNLAIVHLLKGQLEECMNYLRAICEDVQRVNTYKQISGNLFEIYEKEFEPLRLGSKYQKEFESFVNRLSAR
jgi:tetratricopeptide (TPR) repeat protein